MSTETGGFIEDRGSKAIVFAPAVLVMVAIFLLSSRSQVPSVGSNPELSAIAGHLLAYALLGGALFLAFEASGQSRSAAAILAIGIALVFGLSDEFHQSLVPGRTADPWDVLADAAGAIAAAATIAMWRLRRNP